MRQAHGGRIVVYQRPSVDAVRVKQACGLSTLAVAAMAAAGCGDPPVEVIPQQRYDSAGITVVVSHTPSARRVLSAEPRARIGVVSGVVARQPGPAHLQRGR